MKVIGIVGSARKNGNTHLLVEEVLKGAASCGAETELIFLSDLAFKGCIGCEGCNDSFRCVIKDDMQPIYDRLEHSEGLVLGSPTYFYNITSLTKAFIERLYCYDSFDPNDRSVWLSQSEITGTKYAVTVAVCEQKDVQDMGYTSIVMEKSLAAVGYRTVENLKILHAFKKGEVKEQEDALQSAYEAGQKLGRTLKIATTMKRSITR